MKVLVVGGGGREHALCWKLAQESDVHCTPGNPGIREVAECHDSRDANAVAEHVEANLVVIGPEDPLIGGLADQLRASGFPVVGPSIQGAMLEGSKAFSKQLMAEADIPTARFQSFSEINGAKALAAQLVHKTGGVVIKASGQALGKGVVICASLQEAEDALHSMMVLGEFGPAGHTVVVEERLIGREFSLISLVNSQDIVSFPIAQDYKRAYDGDLGLNTGGMGGYSPVNWVSSDLVAETEDRIVRPLLRQLATHGIDYSGVLFTGVMVVQSQPYCLEFNVRFGDPETQSIMRRVRSGLLDALVATASNEPIPRVTITEQAAATVVLCSENYPGAVKKGVPISLGPVPQDVVLFHAGTTSIDGQLCTNGGRVIGVSATGRDLTAARTNAYQAVASVNFEGMRFRSDIGL